MIYGLHRLKGAPMLGVAAGERGPFGIGGQQEDDESEEPAQAPDEDAEPREHAA